MSSGRLTGRTRKPHKTRGSRAGRVKLRGQKPLRGNRGLVDRAIELSGPLPMLLDTRATARMALGQVDAAIEDLEEATNSGPSATRYFHLAQAYRKANRPGDAREALREAKALGLDEGSLHPMERKGYHQLLGELPPMIRGPGAGAPRPAGRCARSRSRSPAGTASGQDPLGFAAGQRAEEPLPEPLALLLDLREPPGRWRGGRDRMAATGLSRLPDRVRLGGPRGLPATGAGASGGLLPGTRSSSGRARAGGASGGRGEDGSPETSRRVVRGGRGRSARAISACRDFCSSSSRSSLDSSSRITSIWSWCIRNIIRIACWNCSVVC